MKLKLQKKYEFDFSRYVTFLDGLSARPYGDQNAALGACLEIPRSNK